MIFPEEFKEKSSYQRNLQKENELLEERLKMIGAKFGCDEKVSPEIYNLFLKSALECESNMAGPTRSIRSLFPKNFKIPKPGVLQGTALGEKIDKILDLLEEHDIRVDLAEELPDQPFYRYLYNTVLNDKIPVTRRKGEQIIYNGCTGDCNGCFQAKYCMFKEGL